MKNKFNIWFSTIAVLISTTACLDKEGNFKADASPYVFNTVPSVGTLDSFPSEIILNFKSSQIPDSAKVYMVIEKQAIRVIQLNYNFITVDSTSECTPILKYSWGSEFAMGSSQFAALKVNLTNNNCDGKKIVLKVALDNLVATYGEDNQYKRNSCGKDWEGWYIGLTNEKACSVSNNTIGTHQLLSYTIKNSSTLSSACQAINAIGEISVNGSGASDVQSVGSLNADEKVKASYTMVSGTGDLRVRWLDHSQSDLDLISSPTASGTSSASAQPVGAEFLRVYVVSGQWKVTYNCDRF